MSSENVAPDGSAAQVSRDDLPGVWLAFGEGGSLVKMTEQGSYRFGPDLREDSAAYDDSVYEQGTWDFADGVLSFVSNEFSANCGQGERGDYRLTKLEGGDLMLDREQDQCAERSQESVRFYQV